MLSPDELELIDQAFDGFHIPSKPDILTKIEHMLKLEQPDITELAELVAQDIGVSSVVLKTINAPFYGMSRSISEIKQAVMLLGVEMVRVLVVGVILRRTYNGNSCISLERFWDNIIDIADTMVFIGSRIKDKVSIDKLYTVGLFHNCAIPAFAIKYSDYHEVLAYQDEMLNLNVSLLENDKYGCNHAVIGYYIANAWGLPKEICHVIRHHHDTHFLEQENDDEARLIFATLKLAENMVYRLRRFKDSSDWALIDKSVLEVLHIDKDEFDDIEDDLGEMFNTKTALAS